MDEDEKYSILLPESDGTPELDGIMQDGKAREQFARLMEVELVRIRREERERLRAESRHRRNRMLLTAGCIAIVLIASVSTFFHFNTEAAAYIGKWVSTVLFREPKTGSGIYYIPNEPHTMRIVHLESGEHISQTYHMEDSEIIMSQNPEGTSVSIASDTLGEPLDLEGVEIDGVVPQCYMASGSIIAEYSIPTRKCILTVQMDGNDVALFRVFISRIARSP